jgi:hypothetical protein
MHYVTHRSNQMQKHKFGDTCPDALFMETALSPPEHEKYCVNASRIRCNRMHYVTHRSHQMQKDMFYITCPDALYRNRIGPNQA